MGEKVTITVRASGAHPDVLTVQDAMRQVLDLFDLLSPDEDKQDQVAWKLSYASTNSPFTAQGEAVSLRPDVDISVIARHQKLDFVRNITSIGRGEIPDKFKSGKNAELLKGLLKRNTNGVGSTEIKLFDDAIPITLTPRFAEAAIQSLAARENPLPLVNLKFGRAREERGSLEGYFMDVGLHYNQPAIRILDRKTKNVIWCRIDEETRDKIASEADYNDVWNRQRIRVKGRIRYDKEGRIVHVTATSIDRVALNNTSLDDIFDPHFTGELSASQYLDLLREGNLAKQA
ncbi:hypothetical protein [Methylobacterium sp. Leaf85]|uniref:hypothetical protein n=1 Tax=Methylobacterium sp. Leaf85 TaxID=1736241 RepID=UPI000A665BBE|nr:hypothetical protein [Methylobacterium sp. Leaf85]